MQVNDSVPVGTVISWYGQLNRLPDGWALCDGINGTPDLRGRFIVGYDSTDAEYNSIGKIGGSKTIALSVDQMPQHFHELTYSGAHNHHYSDCYFQQVENDWKGGGEAYQSKVTTSIRGYRHGVNHS